MKGIVESIGGRDVCMYVCMYVFIYLFIYEIAHNRAIRPCPTSHYMLLAYMCMYVWYYLRV